MKRQVKAPACPICGHPRAPKKQLSKPSPIDDDYLKTCGAVECVHAMKGFKRISRLQETTGHKVKKVSGKTLSQQQAESSLCHICGGQKEIGKQVCANCLPVSKELTKKYHSRSMQSFRDHQYYLKHLKQAEKAKAVSEFDRICAESKAKG